MYSTWLVRIMKTEIHSTTKNVGESQVRSTALVFESNFVLSNLVSVFNHHSQWTSVLKYRFGRIIITFKFQSQDRTGHEIIKRPDTDGILSATQGKKPRKNGKIYKRFYEEWWCHSKDDEEAFSLLHHLNSSPPAFFQVIIR